MNSIGLSRHSPRLISMLDVFGIGFFPAYTDKADPTIEELIASYRNNKNGNDTLQALAEVHTRYGKPVLITDLAYGSFYGANLGEDQLFRLPREQLKVDYRAQVNLYEAFLRAMASFKSNWLLGVVFDSFDRIPYSWKDRATAVFLGSAGESLREKPALQTLTRWYQSEAGVAAPTSGWWRSPETPGLLYALEAEAGIVRLAGLDYSSGGAPQWSWARCIETSPGKYVGRAQFYSGGATLNGPPAQPNRITDGSKVNLEFDSAATARFSAGDHTVFLERYPFSETWASTPADAPRTGWWDQVDQSGRGYFIEAQGDKLLVGGLLYSESGQPAWFTASGALEGKRTFSAGLAFEGLKPDTTWAPGEQAIKLEFVSPWRAILSLGKETPVEIRRYRPREIGWAGLTPEFTGKAVVSAASFRQGITPGGIVSIYGTGLTRGLEGVTAASSPQLPISLQGTSVTVNGRPAPLYSLSRTDGTERIDFQVPYELAGQKAATVMVMNNGAVSAAIQVDAFPVHPALFTTDGSHLVALRANGTPATAENAPMSGETISVFGAGLGPVTPVPETGSPAPSDPPSTMDLAPIVHFNAKMAEVVYAGLAPGVAGLYRIDLIVPDRVGIGDLTFYINVSGLNSNVVKIPVQSGQFR